MFIYSSVFFYIQLLSLKSTLEQLFMYERKLVRVKWLIHVLNSDKNMNTTGNDISNVLPCKLWFIIKWFVKYKFKL